MNNFVSGDLVKLMSGGVDMTVREYRRKTVVVCNWFDGVELKEANFDEKQLVNTFDYVKLAKKAVLLLDSIEYKFETSCHGKLYNALADATHKFYAASNGVTEYLDVLSLKKFQRLVESIPDEYIKEWIGSKEWEEYL